MLGTVARLQAVQEEERAQLHAVEAAAAKLQQSCDDVQSSRIMQSDLAESIASMQSLLKVTFFGAFEVRLHSRLQFCDVDQA